MKLLLFSALIGMASTMLSNSQLQSQYLQAKAKWSKDVPMVSGTSDNTRFIAFSEVAQYVDDHNTNSPNGWRAELNRFSIETEEEKKLSLGLNVSTVIEEQRRSWSTQRKRRSTSRLEIRDDDTVDYTAWLPPIKDQGYCGSCWAFGATVALEYQVNRARATTATMRSLSEQQYLDCVYESQDHDGCNGGWPATCYTWTQTNGNMIASTADQPYNGVDGTCNTDTHSAISGFQVSGTQYLYSGDSAMTEAVADSDIGVISVAIGVVNSFYSYGDGVYSGENCNSINHAVDVVGYGVDGGVGYFRCRNSWGDWGDDGYINFKRGLDGENINMCAISSYGHYPKVSGEDDGSNDESDGGDGSDGSDGDDSTNACWEADSGDFAETDLVATSDWTTDAMCGSMCGATADCDTAVVSNESTPKCYLVKNENIAAKSGWKSAKMSCFQDGSNGDDDSGEDEETCVWTKIENVKMTGKLTGLDYSLGQCQEQCPTTDNCVACSCKNDNKCMMNKKTNTKNNTKYDGYEMDCSGSRKRK